MKIIEKSTLKTDSAKKRLLSVFLIKIQEITLMRTLSAYKTCASLYEVFETKK